MVARCINFLSEYSKCSWLKTNLYYMTDNPKSCTPFSAKKVIVVFLTWGLALSGWNQNLLYFAFNTGRTSYFRNPQYFTIMFLQLSDQHEFTTRNTSPDYNWTITKWSFPSSVGYILCRCAWRIVTMKCEIAFICISHFVHIDFIANPFFTISTLLIIWLCVRTILLATVL